MGVQSCIYKETSYADGGGSGEHLYGATEDYGAKAACHSVVLGPFTKTSSAFAEVGDTVIWGGKEARIGRVKFPWVLLGVMRTSIKTVPVLPSSEAEATVKVMLGLWDRTDNTRDTAMVFEDKTEGQSEKRIDVDSQRDGKKDQFTMQYVPQHKYTAYLRLDVTTKARVPIQSAFLTADAIADFFGDGFGAQLRFVEGEFDMPDNVTLLCNLTEA
jgi:hypothetical protein